MFHFSGGATTLSRASSKCQMFLFLGSLFISISDLKNYVFLRLQAKKEKFTILQQKMVVFSLSIFLIH